MEPTRPLELLVDARQLAVEQVVVVPELEELRVGELEDLERRLHAGLGVVDERGVPRRHHEIVGQIGQPIAQHLVAFLTAERLTFAVDKTAQSLPLSS